MNPESIDSVGSIAQGLPVSMPSVSLLHSVSSLFPFYKLLSRPIIQVPFLVSARVVSSTRAVKVHLTVSIVMIACTASNVVSMLTFVQCHSERPQICECTEETSRKNKTQLQH